MRKSFVFFGILALAFAARAQTQTSTVADGDWNDPSVWKNSVIPDSDAYYADILNDVSLSDSITLSNIWMKSDSSITFAEGGLLTLGGSASDYSSNGASFVFMGGRLATSQFLNSKAGLSTTFVFGGMDSGGAFKSAVARSMDSTSRLQFHSGSSLNFNVGGKNFVSSKASGLDVNALVYTTGELQLMQGVFLMDFSNVSLDDLRSAGISEDGTYYVALISFGITYKTVGGDEFNPVLDPASADGPYASFAGFEWGNGTSRTNNTLYAAVNVQVPEASSCASVFAALAFAFAVWRRRG